MKVVKIAIDYEHIYMLNISYHFYSERSYYVIFCSFDIVLVMQNKEINERLLNLLNVNKYCLVGNPYSPYFLYLYSFKILFNELLIMVHTNI